MEVALMSHLRVSHLGIRTWPLWLRVVSQSDQTTPDFSPALDVPPPSPQVTFSIRCGHLCQAPAQTPQLTT